MLTEKKYDFLTVDYQMPGEDGIQWIRRLRTQGVKVPIFLVSDSTMADAPQILNELGVTIDDYIEKQKLTSDPTALIDRVHAFLGYRTQKKSERVKNKTGTSVAKYDIPKSDLICIGASTGGTTALVELLSNLTQPCPPIVIVQHITHHFAKSFAERLVKNMGLKLGAVDAGTILQPNHVYMSWGDYHIGVSGSSANMQIKVSEDPPITRHRPSVDYLFDSASTIGGKPKILAILMTGMGADGAQGLLKLKNQGHFTVCENEESCVVYGMPKEAVRIGAATVEADIPQIRTMIESAAGHRSSKFKKVA